ncbi:MAG: DUF1648 domain-containing protein [Deltaproteobacteria bacterium]|nr:MAG: DUF1648 domain-containing protein [Deltaproteobacteria bacterium]
MNRWIFHVLSLLGVVLTYVSYQSLPAKVAIHFGVAGRADRWASKGEWLAVGLILFGGIWLMFVGITSMMRKIPDELVSVPNKEYWLAPENKERFLKLFSNSMYWFGWITQALFLGVGVVVYYGATANSINQPAMYSLLLGYVVATVLFVVGLFKQFRVEESAGKSA